jgi:hypothetical protein
MKAPRFLYSLRPSKCCNAKSLLVQSRPGGFVGQDCLKCQKGSDHVGLADLPPLDCDLCGNSLRATKDMMSNYVYQCDSCGRVWKLGDNLPRWSELFEYSGLAAHGDEVFDVIVQEHKHS